MSTDQVYEDIPLPREPKIGRLDALNTIYGETQGEILATVDNRRILWQPNPEQIAQSNIAAFLRFLEEKYGSEAPTMDRLYEWSIEKPEEFWRAFLDFSNILYEGDDTNVLTYAEGEGRRMIDARWFPDVRLNFAENLLRTAEKMPEKEAIAFFGEDRQERHLTYGELLKDVVRFSDILDACGVERGDRVVALMPNIPETVSAMLATAARGAIWSSVSPEFGADTVVDRFGQLEPKVLIATDGHMYRGKAHGALEKVRELTERIPSIERTIIVPYVSRTPLDITGIPNALVYDVSLSLRERAGVRGKDDESLTYEHLPFNHPLFILFSSGTEDKPKCIVHGAGGTLLNQFKQHLLHTDLRADDTFFFNTRTSWMMWNSLVCALGTGAKIVLYDGDPCAREGRILFDLMQKERVTVFGTAAGVLASLEKMGVHPRATHDLSSLRTILSTGSRLYGSQFDYIYEYVHPTVQVATTSGGTEICGAWATASPVLPVHREELQTRSLGYKVEVFDAEGNPLPPGARGELVCTAPFPSQPVRFWNDPGDKRYLETHFQTYGPSVWHHRDIAELTPSGGMVIHGRSDDRFKRGGVWIESEQIAVHAKKIPEVLEAAVVGHIVEQSERVILFVILGEGQELTEELQKSIRSQIRTGTSPYQIPDIILAVPDLPRTRNGKLSASAVRAVIHGREVQNTDALANPEALEHFQNRTELQY